MSWALKGLAGPLKNKVFALKSGMTLGRQGDIVIPDTKSSSIHARITQDSRGAWLLTDNNSKNGTRIDGERISSAGLTDGLKFFIGDQGFEAFEIKEEVTPPPPPRAVELELPPLPEDVAIEVRVAPQPEPPVEPPPRARRYWHEILAEFVATNEEHFSERKRPVSALTPALIFEFVRGVQVSSKWILGYGPRKVGPSALDLPIWEPGAPAVCFEILPSPDGVVFKTAHPDLVTVNGEALDSHVLRVGDKITINETIIEVDFEQ